MRINETHARSLIKATSFRIIEIGVDFGILSFFVEPHVAIGLAVSFEVICFLLHYGFERIWNKINFGRYIINE